MAAATAIAAPAAAPKSSAPRAPGVVELKGAAEFKPAAPVAEFLNGQKTSSVDVRFGNLARGPIEVATVKAGEYRIQKQRVPLTHPLFVKVAETVPGLAPCLVLHSE